ncbi:FkbM family methyltransferase [Pseudahrensia aquimaris]|uniref:FkbM family methyltransferase n=1 Tax=Pseudahrensia aquimaris TaxID=744461 RepID=A0ABW3FBN6_9HYPH
MIVEPNDLLRGLDTNTSFGAHQSTFSQRLIWRVTDWPALPAGLRRRLRKRYARPVVGPFDVVHEGMKFRLYPAENYCDRVIFGRGRLPEKAEHDALLPYIKPSMVFVDIGANVGSYSAFVGTRAGGDVTLLALEPHPRTHAKLLFNLAANGLPVRHVVNCGVGEERGSLPLWSDGGSNIGHTSMLKEGTSNPAESVTVSVVPLLEILMERHIKAIDVLKIDIEGFEDRALAPFLDQADEDLLPKAVLIETVHRTLWKRDVLAMLGERGYTREFATRENELLVKPSSPSSMLLDD